MVERYRVRMVDTAVGPDFQGFPEQVVEVSAAVARAMVAGGHAVAVDALPSGGPETAESRQTSSQTAETGSVRKKGS